MSDCAVAYKSCLDIVPIEIPDILHYIFQFSSPIELLLNVACVSQFWYELVKNNKSLWLYNCDKLWSNKIYINPSAEMMKYKKPVDAFQMSWIDRKRNVINTKELTSIKWNFRFKFIPRNNALNIDCKQTISCKFMPDHKLIHEPKIGNFRWQFVQKEGEFDLNSNGSGLRRSTRRFNGSFHNLNEFDINSKNSTNHDEETNHGWDEWLNNHPQNSTNNDEDDDDVNVQQSITTNDDLEKSRWVKINRFPPLCVFRDKNWRFILENEHVIFTSN